MSVYSSGISVHINDCTDIPELYTDVQTTCCIFFTISGKKLYLQILCIFSPDNVYFTLHIL